MLDRHPAPQLAWRNPTATDILGRVTGTELRLGQERDLFARLLELRTSTEPRADVAAILALLVETVNARRAYLEMYAAADRTRPHWTITHGCSGVEESAIRAVTSRGIVAAALASGTTVHTPYAALDDRFASLPSVRDQRLEAVLCVPLGNIGGGVLYIEGRHDGGPFATPDIRLAEMVARHLWPAIDAVSRAHDGARDPTRPYRERLRLDGILGRSAALARVFQQVEPYARLDITLLITGDSGTGKTQLARAIHDNSPRRSGPFVELNCAAIPEGLIESELFGTMPSAFPGARRTPGKVEAAEGGTLFLDEIGEIAFGAQGKLLQLLQSRQYYALASTKLTSANIRLIAATNVDLPAMVAARRFREDLLYRINVVTIRMPSLAERHEDLGILVDELLVRIAHDHRISALPASSGLHAELQAREWRGNIRQLRHAVEGALIRANADAAPQVEARHLQDAVSIPQQPTFHEATRHYQRELLRRELAAQQWSVAAVAERLDLTRSHIYNLIHQFGLKRDDE